MKCPACVELGLVSRLDEHRSPREPAPVDRFYDEAGVQHIHDHGLYSEVFICSHKHAYTRRYRSRCPVRTCTWNDNGMVKAGEAPLGSAPKTADAAS